mmetsp:Transcript_39619/g.91971  ORF Transcript_39619/g.91971 Transcript_39619/m.91971 type:complete len:102 (-) Transcript_39619:616-921(-)
MRPLHICVVTAEKLQLPFKVLPPALLCPCTPLRPRSCGKHANVPQDGTMEIIFQSRELLPDCSRVLLELVKVCWVSFILLSYRDLPPLKYPLELSKGFALA